MSVMLYICIFCIALSIDLCVFVLAIFLVVMLLLKVMEVLSVGGGALFDRPCMVFQTMCVLCL